MTAFNPGPNDSLNIGGYLYTVKPHPSVPAFAFGQEGRKAFVFQMQGGPENGLYALKKFKDAFRVPELVEVCDSLARFAPWRGLEVCARQCLHYGAHDDALSQYPDLEYAVLMPWITGSTWYDIVISETPLSRLEALTFANATAQVLASLEEAALAHCDIAAPNIIINGTTGRAHLIDVEDLYAPGFTPPSALPAGTDGYAHLTAGQGLWGPTADRFAGAVLITEMAAWYDPRIRRKAEEEHYFNGAEMQQDSPHYQLMREVLETLNPPLGELFDQAWFSETLDDCPPLKFWGEAINELHHRESVAKVVGGWQPIVVPGGAMLEPEPRAAREPEPAVQPPQAEPEEVIRPAASAPAPAPAAPISVQPIQPAPAAPIKPPQAKPPAVHAPTTGGPVVEWVPLEIPLPQASASNGQQPTGNRPITMPATPAAPLEVSSEPEPVRVPDPIDVPEPATSIVMEPSAPTQVHAYPDLDEAEAEAPSVPVEDHAPGLKPLLELSHIDNRNKPYLVWTETPGATGYLLQEADNPGFQGAKEYRVKADETKWHPPLLWGRTGLLHYRVRAVKEGEKGLWSDILIIRIGASR
jgi:hypothetical protein